MLKNIKNIWISCAVLGIVLTVFGTMMMNVFPSTAHNIADGYGGPVYAFEMVTTADDLINVFGPEGDPLRAERIAQMDKGNYLDFPFMLLYALFMAAFLWAVRLETGKKIWALLAGLSLLSGVFDAIENVILLGLTKDLEAAHNIGLLTYPVWAKFLAIWVCTSAAGLYLIKQPNMIWRISGLIVIASTASILMAFYSPSDYGVLIRSGVTIAWIIVLVYAIVQTFASSKVQ